MREKEVGYFIQAIIFVIIFVLGMFGESAWFLTSGIFIGILIQTVLSYGIRSVFRTRKSYFYPNVLFLVIGIIMIVMGLIKSDGEELVNLFFGIYFAASAVLAAPTYLIFNDKQTTNELTGK